jgi:hypothetical protein
MTYGQTVVFDGGTVYSVSGFPTAEAALWAAFRGIAITYRMRGVPKHQRARLARKELPKEMIRRLDDLALSKIVGARTRVAGRKSAA